MRIKRLALALLISLLPFMAIYPTQAANRDKGLLISPLRNYIKVSAGHSQTGVLTVANLTSKPIVANLSVQQFSVADYTYSYIFKDAKTNWIKLEQTQLPLQPGKSQNVKYSVSPPANTAPGGQYYTLLASANLSASGISGTVQAATLLYITVNGKLVQTGRTESSSIKRWVFEREIPYDITLRNTGNVHYFVFVSGRLQGLFTDGRDQSATHLLMPNTVRRMGGTIDSPTLPGIYKATYGYKTDSGASEMRSEYIFFTPPWSIAALLLIVIGVRSFLRRWHSVRRRNGGIDD